MNKALVVLLIFGFTILSPAFAFSHGGGLDGNGGHNNRKTGGYHCHRCPCGCEIKEEDKTGDVEKESGLKAQEEDGNQDTNKESEKDN